MNDEKFNFINEYIEYLNNAIDEFYQSDQQLSNENFLFDVIIEIAKIFKKDIPELEDSFLLRTGTGISDANLLLGFLKKYLIENGYKPSLITDSKLIRFWTSFMTYFELKLPNINYLKDIYISYDNLDGGSYFIDIDYNYEFNLHLGVNYNKDSFTNIGIIKDFIELSFKEWIKPEKRYDFTKDVNDLFSKFNLPYRLQKGKILSQGYKTSTSNNKIINYDMLERKIQYSEEMILSSENLDKKCALDYIIDSLQYILSIQDGKNVVAKYASGAKKISDNLNGKVYAVIKKEIDELMKISNEYFDIRHNEYLNKSKEVRESITDATFIEYLYNRAYALLYILKLKN